MGFHRRDHSCQRSVVPGVRRRDEARRGRQRQRRVRAGCQVDDEWAHRQSADEHGCVRQQFDGAQAARVEQPRSGRIVDRGRGTRPGSPKAGQRQPPHPGRPGRGPTAARRDRARTASPPSSCLSGHDSCPRLRPQLPAPGLEQLQRTGQPRRQRLVIRQRPARQCCAGPSATRSWSRVAVSSRLMCGVPVRAAGGPDQVHLPNSVQEGGPAARGVRRNQPEGDVDRVAGLVDLEPASRAASQVRGRCSVDALTPGRRGQSPAPHSASRARYSASSSRRPAAQRLGGRRPS